MRRERASRSRVLMVSYSCWMWLSVYPVCGKYADIICNLVFPFLIVSVASLAEMA